MSVSKEIIDSIVEEYFKQPSKSLESIIFNEHAKDITLEELKQFKKNIKQ